MTDKQQLVTAIGQYEEGKLAYADVCALIKKLCSKDVERTDLDSYSGSQSVETFCDGLLMQPISEWQTLSENEALLLIGEMLNNLTNDALLHRNGEALEKRYGKPTGTIMNLIFYEAVNTADAILEQLKRNTTIRL